MTIPSRVLGSGVNSLSTVAICGDGGTGLSSAGSSSSDATQLVKVYNNLTTVSSGSGVKLPPTEEGEVIYITNSGANSLKVYPYETATTIDGGVPATINTGCSALFFAVSNSAWQGLQGFNSAIPILHYGSFYDTTTQTAAAVSTAYAMTLDNTAASNGVYIGSPTSRIYVSNTGVYNIQFSAQLDKASGAAGHTYIWLDIDGTSVANSASEVAIQGTTAEMIAAWNFVVSLTAGQYFRLMWSVDDTNIHIKSVSAAAPVPAIPSVILTVTQVNNL